MKAKYMTMIVRDMEESVAFYRDTMGFPVDSTYDLGPAGRITLMQAGDAMIELIESSRFPVGLYSVGMDVDDLEETLAGLKAKGARVTMEPVPTSVGRMAFVQDPNGVNLALIQHHR